jgi:hypothetical protein
MSNDAAQDFSLDNGLEECAGPVQPDAMHASLPVVGSVEGDMLCALEKAIYSNGEGLIKRLAFPQGLRPARLLRQLRHD